jgi:hypothetical protein
MKIEIIKDHDYRHRPAVIQSFRTGQTPNVPKKVADALISQGAAKPITTDKE